MPYWQSDQTICPRLFAALDFITVDSQNLKQCFVLPTAGIKCILESVTDALVIKNLFDAVHVWPLSILGYIYGAL